MDMLAKTMDVSGALLLLHCQVDALLLPRGHQQLPIVSGMHATMAFAGSQGDMTRSRRTTPMQHPLIAAALMHDEG